MLNIIDRVFDFFSPELANKRLRARVANEMLSRSYDAGGRGRRWSGRKVSKGSAEAEIGNQKNLLRFRSRELIRNSPEAANAVATWVANVVGDGIRAKIQDNLLRQAWLEWTQTVQADFFGDMNFAQIQQLVANTVAESGSCLVMRVRSNASGLAVPFRLQVLEPDFINQERELTLRNGNEIRYGIEYDRQGRRVAYHLYGSHPGDAISLKGFNRETRRVPASEIAHIFHKTRPGQHDGVPLLTPVMLRMRDYDDYEDAQLVRQKIAACFVGFVLDQDGPVNSAASSADQMPISEKFEPGAWEPLPPGKDIKFASPPGVGQDYEAYSRRQLMRIASGVGLTYEQLTGDYSQTNFTSGRMGKLEFQAKLTQWQYQMIVPMLLEKVWGWFFEGATLAGITNDATSQIHDWTAPAPQLIDPSREVKAYREAVRSGFKSISEVVREMGFDPDRVREELKEDTDRANSLDLKLDSIPSHTTTAGIIQMEQSE